MRIQRDRNEQLFHRQTDSGKLIQRNRNILVDLLNRQNQEAKRTQQFGNYVVSKNNKEQKKFYRAEIKYPPFLRLFKHA